MRMIIVKELILSLLYDEKNGDRLSLQHNLLKFICMLVQYFA